MKFSEAMRHYEQGKAVRLKGWSPSLRMVPGESFGYLDIVVVVKQEWELYKAPEFRLSMIKEGELFEFAGMKYRRLPSYMMEYAPVQLPGWDIVAIRQQAVNEYPAGSVAVFTSDCQVKKVS